MAVRALAAQEADAAAAVLATAFADDPLWQTLYPDPGRRRKALGLFFRAFTSFAAGRHTVLGRGDPLHAVAIWQRPGGAGGRIGLRALTAWAPLLTSTLPLRAVRARGVFGGFAEMRRTHLPDPHFFLETIGTVAEQRGTGAAGALIRPCLAAADAGGFDTWTETVTPGNVDLYRHFGFELVEQRLDRRTGLDLYGFVRRSRP